MSSLPSLSEVDRPWIRSLLPCACSLLIFVLLIVSLLGPDLAKHLWKISSSLQKMLVVVTGCVYVLVSYVILLGRQSLDSSWSEKLLGDSETGRFSEFGFYRKFFDSYAETRYGMNATTYWPRLFMSLPADAKAAFIETRNSYITSQSFSATLSFWFSTTCPMWCGMLLLLALLRSEYRLGSLFIVPFLMFSDFAFTCFDVQAFFVLRRFQIMYPFLHLFAAARLSLFFVMKMLLGAFLLQCCLGYTQSLLPWQTSFLSMSIWQPGWESIAMVTIEILAIGVLAQSCRWWYLSVGLAYGQTSCALFDLYRKHLADSLGFTLSTELNAERLQWVNHEKFLADGTIMTPALKRITKPLEKESSVWKLLKKLIAEDAQHLVDFGKKTVGESALETSSPLKEAVVNTVAGLFLIFASEFGRVAVLAIFLFSILPLTQLFVFQASFPDAFLLCSGLFLIAPFGALCAITMLGILLIPRSKPSTYESLKKAMNWFLSKEIGKNNIATWLTILFVVVVRGNSADLFLYALGTWFALLVTAAVLPGVIRFEEPTWLWSLIFAVGIAMINNRFDAVRWSLIKRLKLVWFPAESTLPEAAVPTAKLEASVPAPEKAAEGQSAKVGEGVAKGNSSSKDSDTEPEPETKPDTNLDHS